MTIDPAVREIGVTILVLTMLALLYHPESRIGRKSALAVVIVGGTCIWLLLR